MIIDYVTASPGLTPGPLSFYDPILQLTMWVTNQGKKIMGFLKAIALHLRQYNLFQGPE